jgi:hypothetical protein
MGRDVKDFENITHNMRDIVTPNHKNIPVIGDLKTLELCQYYFLKGAFFL